MQAVSVQHIAVEDKKNGIMISGGILWKGKDE